MKTLKTFLLGILFAISFVSYSQEETKHVFTTDSGDVQEPIEIDTTISINDKIIIESGEEGLNQTVFFNDEPPSTFIEPYIYQQIFNEKFEYYGEFKIVVTIFSNDPRPILTINVTVKEEEGTTNTTNLTDIQLNVYPNPFISYVNVDGFVQNWKLFDTTGRLIKTDSPNQENITIYDLDNLKSGAYRLIINDRKVFNIVK